MREGWDASIVGEMILWYLGDYCFEGTGVEDWFRLVADDCCSVVILRREVPIDETSGMLTMNQILVY